MSALPTTDAIRHEKQICWLGDVEFDRAREQLRGKDGVAIPLRPQAIKTLDALVVRAGRIATKNELIDEIWPDTVVTDDSLVQVIGEIRKAIGDRDHSIIETIPKRGYLLHLKQADQSTRATESPLISVWGFPLLLLAGACAFALFVGALVWLQGYHSPARNGLKGGPIGFAVLQLRALTPGDSDISLPAGFAEELIWRLASNQDLRVVSRHSGFSVSNKALGAREISRLLGVRFIVDGRVGIRGEQLIVRLEMIDGTNGRIVSTINESTDLAGFDEFWTNLVSTIAGTANMAAVSLRKQEILASAPSSPDIYGKALRVLALKHQFTPRAYQKARAEGEAAIRENPDYAPLLTHLAYLNFVDATLFVTREWSPSDYGKVDDMIQKSLKLDSSYHVTWQLLSLLRANQFRHRDALAAAEKAVELSPSTGENLAFLAKAQLGVGLLDDALSSIEKAESFFPIPPVFYQAYRARYLWAVRDFDGSVAVAKPCVDALPKYVPCWTALISALSEGGRTEEAEIAVRKMLQFNPKVGELHFTAPVSGSAELLARRKNIVRAASIPRTPGTYGVKVPSGLLVSDE